MMQYNYLASEPLHECSICHETIIHPICPICITTQIQAWLTSYSNYHELKDSLFPELRNFFEKHFKESTECIKCKKARVCICPYCFTEFILDELKRINANKIILKEFLIFFNFDLEHKGYYKEAEKLGVV